jgi:pyridoxal phosphate enzyme (YggS family)
MIAENIARIKATLPQGVRLVAVSKIKPVEDILEAYNAGQRLFGENYATELRDKHAVLPADIQWHFIGHLQAKQIKYYIDFVSMIHGVDTMEHLEDIDRAAAKVGRVVDVLLQCHIAREETKFGFSPDELAGIQSSVATMPHVRVCGIMGMATNTTDQEQVRREFRELKHIFDSLQSGPFAGHPEFRELSMGMSHDYHIAIAEGSTLVRLGTSIFGERDYSKLKR